MKNNNNCYDVLVIGGGAAGMMAAISAVRGGAKKVAIIEHKDQLGAKILTTGNGHCNYTNANMDYSLYESQSASPDFLKSAFERFDQNNAISFLDELGIEPFEKNGYFYPYSMQAKSVRDALVMEIKRLGIDVYVKTNIKNITKNESFEITTDEATLYSKNIIIAVGGISSPKTGSDGSLYKLTLNLTKEIDFVPQRPALCPLHTEFEYIKRISGVRTQAKVSYGPKSEVGELQFGDDCISGIVVFNLSNAVNLNPDKYDIEVDFFPNYSYERLSNVLYKRFRENSNGKMAKEAMIGLLPDKLNDVALSIARIPATEPADQIKDVLIDKLCACLKSMNFGKCKNHDYAKAQITGGGINLSNISINKLDAFGTDGLYFAGEIMDVQGPCGGYNLQWAWTSGYLAGTDAAIRSRNC